MARAAKVAEPKAPKPPGKGLVEKRARIVKLLQGHVRWLTVEASLAPWAPESRAPYPPMPRGGSGRHRALPAYYTPRERPSLSRPMPDGLDAITDAQVAAWIADEPFVRSGFRVATAKALLFLESFAPQEAAA